MRASTIALAAALAALSPTAVRADVVYTATNGPTCRNFSKSQVGDWICPGPGGYVARFSDEGNLASVTIGPGPRAKGRHPMQVLSAGKVFGDKIQWIVVDGVPRAAVLRMFHRADVNDDKELQSLKVFLIESGRTCLFGSIDARQPHANKTALQRAELATRSDCTMK